MKKTPPKRNKPTTQKNVKTENPRVLSLIGKLEKKTEKQMASFVKELVRLKKQQVKLEKKIVKTKDHSVKTKKKKAIHTPIKKKNVHKFKLIENLKFEPKD